MAAASLAHLPPHSLWSGRFLRSARGHCGIHSSLIVGTLDEQCALRCGRDLEKALLWQAQAALPAGARAPQRGNAGADPDPGPGPVPSPPAPRPPSQASACPAPRGGLVPAPQPRQAREPPEHGRVQQAHAGPWEPDEAHAGAPWEPDQVPLELPGRGAPARRTTALDGFVRRPEGWQGAEARGQAGMAAYAESQPGWESRAWPTEAPAGSRSPKRGPPARAPIGWHAEAGPAEPAHAGAASAHAGAQGYLAQRSHGALDSPPGGISRDGAAAAPAHEVRDEGAQRSGPYRGDDGPYARAGLSPRPGSPPEQGRAATHARPYADARSLEAFMARGQALEAALLRLHVEQQALQAEAARFPAQARACGVDPYPKPIPWFSYCWPSGPPRCGPCSEDGPAPRMHLRRWP